MIPHPRTRRLAAALGLLAIAAATPAARAQVPPGEGLVAALSQFGITWSFERPCETGRFANGDFWVVGPVRITAIDPPSVEVNGRVSNGSMIDPAPGNPQGYDSAMHNCEYVPALNVAPGISAARPLVLKPGQSLVSSISEPEAGKRPQLRTAAVLTCVAEKPPRGSFRPPYAGGAPKAPRLREDQLDTSLLASLEPIPKGTRIEEVERWFERPWIDHVEGWVGRYCHPSENMPDYGQDIATEVSIAALTLHLDIPLERKRTLLVRFVQLGIDLHGIAAAGGGWPPNGGHASGRKWPILFAGLVLHDAGMSGVGKMATLFGEDGQTFRVAETSPGVINHGHGGYGPEDIGVAEWGIRHATDPSLDTENWNEAYRLCCTAISWSGFVLAARIMGAQELWNHDALFDYMDRYHRIQKPEKDYLSRMWRRYRPEY